LTSPDSDLSLLTGYPYEYKDTEKAFYLEIGGGVEKKIEKGLIAAGLYYDYLSSKSDLDLRLFNQRWMNQPVPKTREHRLVLKAAAEKEVSPTATLRAGLEVFHGWADMESDARWIPGSGTVYRQSADIDGSRWGAGASFGASFKIAAVAVEPYLNIAYQETDLDGDGHVKYDEGFAMDSEYKRTEWCYGAGFSVKF
jgi:hypothetical protein